MTAVRELIRRNHLARNSVLIMTSTGVTGVLGFIYWGVAAHGYNTSVIGVATALLAAMNLMSLIGALGIGQTIVQRLPRADDATWSRLVNCVVFAGGAAGCLVGVVGVLVLPRVSSQFDVVTTPVVLPLVVLGTGVLTVANLLDYVFIAQRAAQHVLGRSVVFGVGKLALLLVLPLLAASRGLPTVIGSWALGAALTSVITAVVLVPRLGRPHRWTPRGVAGELRRLAPQLALNHVISLSAALVPTLMPTLVVARVSAEQNAYFYIAWLIAGALLTVSAAVSGALLTEGSYQPERLAGQVRRGVLLISALLVAPVLVLGLAGRPILGLFGAGYAAHSYGPLLLFLVVVVPDAITNIYITVLRVRGEHRVGAVVNVAMSVVTLGLAWLLLPRFGVTAAGWSWAIGQCVGVAIMMVRALRRRSLAA